MGLAIDLFDGNVTTDFNQADMLVAGTKSHFDRTVQTIVAWLDWLRSDNRTTGKIGLFWLFVRCPHDRTRRSGRPSGCIRALRRHGTRTHLPSKCEDLLVPTLTTCPVMACHPPMNLIIRDNRAAI